MDNFGTVWNAFVWYAWYGFSISMILHFVFVGLSSFKWFEFWAGGD